MNAGIKLNHKIYNHHDTESDKYRFTRDVASAKKKRHDNKSNIKTFLSDGGQHRYNFS